MEEMGRQMDAWTLNPALRIFLGHSPELWSQHRPGSGGWASSLAGTVKQRKSQPIKAKALFKTGMRDFPKYAPVLKHPRGIVSQPSGATDLLQTNRLSHSLNQLSWEENLPSQQLQLDTGWQTHRNGRNGDEQQQWNSLFLPLSTRGYNTEITVHRNVKQVI